MLSPASASGDLPGHPRLPQSAPGVRRVRQTRRGPFHRRAGLHRRARIRRRQDHAGQARVVEADELGEHQSRFGQDKFARQVRQRRPRRRSSIGPCSPT